MAKGEHVDAGSTCDVIQVVLVSVLNGASPLRCDNGPSVVQGAHLLAALHFKRAYMLLYTSCMCERLLYTFLWDIS